MNSGGSSDAGNSSLNTLNHNNNQFDNSLNRSNNGNTMISPMNQLGMVNNNQINQINQIDQNINMNMNMNTNMNMNMNINQMNMNQINNQFNQLNQMNQIPQSNQISPQQQQQQQQGLESRGWNPAYVQSLLRKIQPGPGMTKQQRFQQLLRSGELTRTDVQILQRHQQMLRQAQAARQKQAQQVHQAQQVQQQREQQQFSSLSGKSIPGKSIPGKSIPGKSIPGKSIPGKSIPGKSIPGKSIPGKSIPGKSIPGKSIPGKSIPGKSIPGKSLPGTSTSLPDFPIPQSHLPTTGNSLSAKIIPQQSEININTPIQPPVNLNLPVNISTPTNLNSTSNLSSISHNSIVQHVNSIPVNQQVNQPVNRPVNQPVNQLINQHLNQQVNRQPVMSINQQNQVNGSSTPITSQQKQDEQKKILEQRQQQKFFGLTAEQYNKLTIQQKQMLKLQHLRRKAKTQRFYESDQELLKKYENNTPSLDFHIHEDHYRFGHNDNLIPKSNPAIKDFLKYIAKKKIPDALMEIIKDGNIQLYDGNIILRIYDHRIIDNIPTSNLTHIKSEGNINVNNSDNCTTTNTANPNKDNPNDLAENSKPVINSRPKKFREYRTVLRLTQSALYEDFCLATDTQMFGDSFVLTYESEILTSTTRSVNLQPISNPYLEDRSLWPTYEMITPKYDEKRDEMIFQHRQDMREISDTNVGNKEKYVNYENYRYKPLHQDESQSNSKYEKLMLIMGQSMSHSNISTNKQTVDVPRFERLRFIENLRRQNLVKKENNLRGVSSVTSPPLNGYNKFGSIIGGVNGQKPFAFQNKPVDEQSTEAHNNIKTEANETSSLGTSSNGKGKTGKAAGAKAATGRKKADKPKKPRKPTKKQLAAQAAAQAAAQGSDGVVSEVVEPPKKKRAPAKKKNTSTAANSLASTPANNNNI